MVAGQAPNMFLGSSKLLTYLTAFHLSNEDQGRKYTMTLRKFKIQGHNVIGMGQSRMVSVHWICVTKQEVNNYWTAIG